VRNPIPQQKGFLIIEVLIVIMIIAITFVAFMGAMAQGLRVSSKSDEITDAISRYESFLFEIENGLRPDLAGYGGNGDLAGGYCYQIKTEKSSELTSLLQSQLSWKENKECLNLEVLVSKAPAQ